VLRTLLPAQFVRHARPDAASERRSPRAYHAAVGTFRHGEVDLAYDASGSAGAEPVLLLNGLGSSRRQWHRFLPELTSAHRVFTLDHRGHGGSSHAAAASYTLAHYGADALAFVVEIIQRPAVLVGHSLGGVVAHYVACSRPELVRGLFLMDPPLFARDGDDGRQASGFFPGVRQALREARAHAATPEQHGEALRALPLTGGQATLGEVLGDELLHGMAEDQLRLDPEVFTPAIDGTIFRGLEPTARISCPVTVLRADPSRWAEFTVDDERRFRAANPHATIHEVPGAGHVVHADAPREFIERLNGFLRSVG
jgi:pimeloyl-ACP methyl ester carboxylesterase